MAITSVQELIERARSAADMSDNFVTQAEWIRWANVENRKLAAFIARTGWVLQEDVHDVVADGSAVYSVPEVMAILGVYEMSGGRYRRLRHSDIMDGAGRIAEDIRGTAMRWRVTQNAAGTLDLHLHPRPSSGTYRVVFVPQPAPLTSEADTVNYPMNWEEYVVYGMAKRALAKEETTNPRLESEADDVSRHIEQTCWDRLMGAHQKIRNVDRVERGWSADYNRQSAVEWYWV
jgi:hypothetical protein